MSVKWPINWPFESRKNSSKKLRVKYLNLIYFQSIKDKITKRQILYFRLFLLFAAIITCFSGCIIVNLILSRFEGNCVLYTKLVEDSYSQPANPSFLISEFGPRSNCGFIIVVSEIILISAPFLLILLAIEFHTDPQERIAALWNGSINYGYETCRDFGQENLYQSLILKDKLPKPAWFITFRNSWVNRRNHTKVGEETRFGELSSLSSFLFR